MDLPSSYLPSDLSLPPLLSFLFSFSSLLLNSTQLLQCLIVLQYCNPVNCCLHLIGPSCSVKRGTPTSVMCTMRRASTCFAKAHRSCCCQREHCRRDLPDPRGTSSVVQTACRCRHTNKLKFSVQLYILVQKKLIGSNHFF